jgi:DNA-binding response OmpR family regulator
MGVLSIAVARRLRIEDERAMTVISRSCGSGTISRASLVVEDELRMAGLIRRGLASEGLVADVAGTGEEALWLPGLSGFETCRRLRSSGVRAPVLMLTARDSAEDRVTGLDTGADDYLVKPFAFAELLARLRALVPRGELERPSVLEVGDKDQIEKPRRQGFSVAGL